MFPLHSDVIKSWYSVLLDDCCDKFLILIKVYLQMWHVEEEIIHLSFILYVTVRSAWETSTHSKTDYSQMVGVIKVLMNESSNRTSDILWHKIIIQNVKYECFLFLFEHFWICCVCGRKDKTLKLNGYTYFLSAALDDHLCICIHLVQSALGILLQKQKISFWMVFNGYCLWSANSLLQCQDCLSVITI